MQTKEINDLEVDAVSEKADRESNGDRAAEPDTIGIERKYGVQNRVGSRRRQL